jgi:hypothetical protein
MATADGKKGNELQGKSELKNNNGEVAGFTHSYPSYFNEFTEKNNASTNAAVSTGYYFYDNEQAPITKNGAVDLWHPTGMPNDSNWRNHVADEYDVLKNSSYLHRIFPGPRLVDSIYWQTNSLYGKHYFRNPADLLGGSVFDKDRDDLDSTENAIAGPMPIGIRDGFYFNGVRYDSFYVSTKGVIALSNRRYMYNSQGERVVPTGSDHAYDVQSMDWFVNGAATNYPSGTRSRIGNPDGDYDNGMNSAIADNFGYKYSVLGSNPTVTYATPVDDPAYTADAGIRSAAIGQGNLVTAMDNAYGTRESHPAIIAPFWGNLSMSQYDKQNRVAQDYSKVYFKYSPSGTELVVSFINVGLKGQVQTPPVGDDYVIDADSRLTDDGYVEWDAHVVFSKIDSSVTYIFEDFRGHGRTYGNDDLTAVASAGDMVRANTLCGVIGWARHTNHDNVEGNANYPWSEEYLQLNHYYARYLDDAIHQSPFNGTTVKFKQWRNVTRAADIALKVRDVTTVDNPSLDHTVVVENPANYEVLAGEQLLGSIQPVAMIQNLSNDLQGVNGVNYMRQKDFVLYSQFRLQNATTGRTIYSKTIPVNKQCMSSETNANCFPEEGALVRLVKNTNDNYSVNSTLMSPAEYVGENFTGLPSYYHAQIQYPPFEANEFVDEHIGRMQATLIAVTAQEGKDQWPFDDTIRTSIYIMRRLTEFADNGSDFHRDMFTGVAVPSPLKWVSVNADIVSGDEVSQHAMPPRGKFAAISGASEAYEITSPVIRLNRTMTAVDGSQVEVDDSKDVYVPYAGTGGNYRGDEIRSFPIDLRDRFGAVLSLSVQRGNNYYDGWVKGKSRFWTSGKAHRWGDNPAGNHGNEVLHGPEARVVVNNNLTSVGRSAWSGANGYPDMLVVEFAKPSNDGVTGITNIPEENWRYNPHRRGIPKEAVTDIPALTIFGGGGKMVGFLEADPDSAMDVPNGNNLYGLVPDLYDTGVDYEFKKHFIAIPDTFINWENDGARNFRFRVRTLARNNQVNPRTPTEADDNDDFYVDNVYLTYPAGKTDIELNSVKVNWPYSFAPASQLTSIPIEINLSNNTNLTAPVFSVNLRIWKKEHFDFDSYAPKNGECAIYSRTETVANFVGGQFQTLDMPAWNARKFGEGEYVLEARVHFPGGDLYADNNVTYSIQKVGFAEAFQYESTTELDSTGYNLGVNDVPAEQLDEFGNPEEGRGIGVPGYTAGFNVGKEQQIGAGPLTDGTAGKFAVKFHVATTDSIRGYQIYLGGLDAGDQSFEVDIVKNIYDLETLLDMPSDTTVNNAYEMFYRGRISRDDYDEYYFDQYLTYELKEPVELPVGTYWVILTQNAPEPMQLGASADRMGMKVTNYATNANNNTSQLVFTDDAFRVSTVLPSGKPELINGNYFCFANGNTAGSTWVPFSPYIGNIAYPHTNNDGLSTDNTTRTYTNGTWIPMIKPYFGPKTSGEGADEYTDDCHHNPVELTTFNGTALENCIELVWETASETNNAGFELERRVKGQGTWTAVGFVEGHGNSKTRQYYTMADYDVVPGKTYLYQLRQVDNDGTISCDKSKIVEVTFDYNGEMQLSQNAPNPVNYRTSISFELTETTDYKVEVIDMYGRLIKVLDEGNKPAGTYKTEWYADDTNGDAVVNGTYLYRLTAGDKVITNKMTVLK